MLSIGTLESRGDIVTAYQRGCRQSQPFGLLVEQGVAEVPEFGWVGLQDGDASFVDEGRGGMPRLNLLTEDELHLICILLLHNRIHGAVDSVEDLL